MREYGTREAINTPPMDTPKMRLYVIRHGHRADREEGYDGGGNTPLSETGEQQVEHLAEFVAGEDIDRLYSSCQLRALQTAEAVHRRVDGEWHVWPVFCETSTDTWGDRYRDSPELAERATVWRTDEPVETPTFEEVEERHGNYYLLSNLAERFPDVQLSQPFPWPDAWWEPREGHTRTMGYARVELGLQALLDRHDDGDRIALVCHGNCGDKLMTALMDFPRRQARRFSFDNTGVARLDRRESGEWRIVYANRTCHLTPELQV